MNQTHPDSEKLRSRIDGQDGDIRGDLEQQEYCQMAPTMTASGPYLVATDGLSPEMTVCESATEALVNIVKGRNKSEQSCPIREHGQKPKSLVGQMTWDSKMRPLKTKSQGPRTGQQNRVSKITRDAGGACPNHKRQKKFVRGMISVTV